MGDERPVMLVFVSGNESVITEQIQGTYQILIDIINPNATIFYENRSVQVPLKYAPLTNISTAAMDLVDNRGNKGSVEILI